MRKPVVGAIGASERDALTEAEKVQLKGLAEALGAALARHDCVLITGATTGLPDLVSRTFRDRGGLALGVSPASNRREHVKDHGLPDDGVDVIVYTGFGYKGRNVINVRSADIVIVFGGATGTLNEFTIAYDEGKIIGVLEGSGGVADHVREILNFCNKPIGRNILFNKDPERLVQSCFEAFGDRC